MNVRPALLALAVVCCSASATALAAEGQSEVSVTASFAALSVDQGTTQRPRQHSGNGALLGVDYQHAFGESLWLRVGLGGGLTSVDGSASGVFSGVAGLTYTVDILRYVPYLGLGVGGVLVTGGNLDTHVDPVLDLAAGIEVQESPTFAWG